jgi:hypothetical protein
MERDRLKTYEIWTKIGIQNQHSATAPRGGEHLLHPMAFYELGDTSLRALDFGDDDGRLGRDGCCGREAAAPMFTGGASGVSDKYLLDPRV